MEKSFLKEHLKIGVQNIASELSMRGSLTGHIEDVCSKLFELIEEVDDIKEFKKPVVPIFVDDWIKEHKKHNYNFGDAYKRGIEFRWFDSDEWGEWLFVQKNADTLGRAYLNGYTVEEIKK